MNISLPEEMKAHVEAQVKSGQFANASDYVRNLIRYDQRELDIVRAAIEGRRQRLGRRFDRRDHRRRVQVPQALVRLRFSSEARADLFEIVRFGAERWGEEQARSDVAVLRTKLLLLLEHPHLGPPSEEIEVGLRRYPYISHVAYCRVGGGEVRIVRVLHRRMNAETRLG